MKSVVCILLMIACIYLYIENSELKVKCNTHRIHLEDSRIHSLEALDERVVPILPFDSDVLIDKMNERIQSKVDTTNESPIIQTEINDNPKLTLENLPNEFDEMII